MSAFQIIIRPTKDDTILKFESNQFLTKHQSFEFENIDDATFSPLAQQLFHLPFVKKIYLTSHFIAIQRYDIVSWDLVQDEVARQIETYLNEGGSVLTEKAPEQKTSTTIYAERTPNPAVMKFVANKVLTPTLLEYTSPDEAKDAPLAAALFAFPFVTAIFMDQNYISVTKKEDVSWETITQEIREFIRSFIQSGKAILPSNAPVLTEPHASENLRETPHNEISKQIIDILEEYIKPAVAGDGGNIRFVSYEADTGTVHVQLQGACSGCPSSTVTLKNGIETLLKDMLHGKVNHVVAVP